MSGAALNVCLQYYELEVAELVCECFNSKRGADLGRRKLKQNFFQVRVLPSSVVGVLRNKRRKLLIF